MLSNQDNPFKKVDLNTLYLSSLSSLAAEPENCLVSRERKAKAANHLRRVQRSNFFQRAAIHISDFFQKTDAA